MPKLFAGHIESPCTYMQIHLPRRFEALGRFRTRIFSFSHTITTARSFNVIQIPLVILVRHAVVKHTFLFVAVCYGRCLIVTSIETEYVCSWVEMNLFYFVVARDVLCDSTHCCLPVTFQINWISAAVHCAHDTLSCSATATHDFNDNEVRMWRCSRCLCRSQHGIIVRFSCTYLTSQCSRVYDICCTFCFCIFFILNDVENWIVMKWVRDVCTL